MAAKSRWWKRLSTGCLAFVVLLVVLLFVTPAGKALRDIWGSGAVQAALSPKEMREYHASTEANLKAIYNALKLYQDSEGQYPAASGWMDAIQNRILVNDMTGAEAEKKLISPSVVGHPGQYGYALNDKASGKYAGDLDPKMPLVFDSRDLSKNAHGDPAKLVPSPARAGQNMGITVDGTIVKL